ncbi:isoprenylcysteine carboxyl methyltransferase [Spongiactinospora rosea]|uniref:Isoprenylcysteine carboxyl methyltransferase n=1 Tax=Spongiactinospora rosea TaxID=2248750 RepID=A0A366LLF6_9ACTN|nr:isoprenylcysteine carboxylmethyltransferase family protein [Spongiactinospora rosea]RBQ14500.1 isoprenylcysteine carboxyl methyltransferase [Spongiactinospora rosea]
MRRTPAAIVTSIFFGVGPGTVAVLVPWVITRWEFADPLSAGLMPPLRAAGVLLIAGGGAVLVHAFTRFVREGLGTPVPVAPPERLVIGGLYRYVRNPMYVALFAVVAGQALLFGQVSLLLYLALVAGPVVAFVKLREEPLLTRRFGADYRRYREEVPGWWPRVPRR